MSEVDGMIASGIPPLEERLGGAVAGRLHVMSGAPGTGKSTACLQFLHEGLRRGETVALLTSDRAEDLRAQADHLGIDLLAPLRTGRLLLLRYRSGFSALLQHAAVPEHMLDDLRAILHPLRPTRVAMDPIAPLLAAAPHGDATLHAMADLLEEMGSTVLLTLSGDVTAGRGTGYDFRADPLVERAAAVVHLARHADAPIALTARRDNAEPTYELHLVRVRRPVRSMAPASYVIEAGRGIALAPAAHADAVAMKITRRRPPKTTELQ